MSQSASQSENTVKSGALDHGSKESRPEKCIKLCALHPTKRIWGANSAQKFPMQPQSPQDFTISESDIQLMCETKFCVSARALETS
jgi:hypothetical protein